MRILYGVVGEGMGHAIRSRVVIEHLLRQGHQVRVVVSGRAHQFLADRLQALEHLELEEIHGFRLRYRRNRVDRADSLLWAVRNAPAGLARNLQVYRKVTEDRFRPALVISDFESWTALYGFSHRLPVLSIDNLQIIDRCHHPVQVTAPSNLNKRLTKLAVRLKLPGVYHFLVSSFFFPVVAKGRTTLVPPILRPEIIAARREPQNHVLVYQTSSSNEQLIPVLAQLPYEFRVYGMGREGQTERNIHFRPFSETCFVEDLRTARAVISGGSFTLMSEAVHLHVPMLSVPIEQQFEQELNARYLEYLGYGAAAPHLDLEIVRKFLSRVDSYATALERYVPRDNSLLFSCVDELIHLASIGARRPVHLASAALGKSGDVGRVSRAPGEAPQYGTGMDTASTELAK